MVTRICFDIETGFYWNMLDGWLEAGALRPHLRSERTEIRFDCVVLYDAANRRHFELVDTQLHKAIELLRSADELISFNGRAWDLPILEHIVGRKRFGRDLWTKTHHDLSGWHEERSLDRLAEKIIPGRIQELKKKADDRFAILRKKEIGEFIAGRLAKCRFDVDRTYAVFRAYQREKGSDFTFGRSDRPYPRRRNAALADDR